MKKLTLVLMSIGWAFGQAPATQDPVEGIVKLFDKYRIVMLGEIHGCRQEWDILRRLVADPRFAGRVNDIVMEFGNARFQNAVDRYTNGDAIPLSQVQGAWQDVVGAVGPVSPMISGFYSTIRTVNRTLPKGKRIRILLGDPPIDWDEVRTVEDIGPFLPFRDAFYAQVVRYEVIAKRRKALLISGTGHFQRRGGRPGQIENELLMSLVQPYVILPGSNMVGGYEDTDPRFETLPAGSLIELKGTWLGEIAAPAPRGGSASTWAQGSDAYLYLGPRDSVTTVFYTRAELEGKQYALNLQKRMSMLFAKPPDVLPAPDAAAEQAAFKRSSAPPPPLPAIPKPRP